MNPALQPRSYFAVDNTITGQRTELPCFTCCHCNRVVVMNPERQRPRYTCRQCMALTCDSAGCQAGCNDFRKSVELASQDYLGQPWLLRDAAGDPVVRLVDQHGQELLVKQRDSGFADRELERMKEKTDAALQ